MRPVVTPREFEGNLQGETIEFTMDQESLVHLMNQYIDLYHDPKMAILREYSTNAYDSHVEAGNTDPIEITLPSPFAQTLTIKDRGVGLTLDEVRNVLSKYGASTKRESDEYTGALGLGSKSGLAYADQFTMQAVKNGIRTTLSVSRDNRGAASMTVVEKDQATVEPNGVAVTIPTKRDDTFEQEARYLFKYWPEGSVLVNGKPPERFKSSEIAPSLYLHKRVKYNSYEQSVVVMGNVPYPVHTHLFGISDLTSEHVVTAFVPMGAVEFPADREGLRLTTHTKETLCNIGNQLRDSMKEAAQADVNNAPNAVEAIERVISWTETLPNTCLPKEWSYGGAEIPATFSLDTIELPDPVYEDQAREFRPSLVVIPQKKRSLSHHDSEKSIPRGTLVDAVIFTDFSVKWTGNYRKKLDIWQRELGDDAHKPHHYLLLQGQPPASWLHWMPEGRVHSIDKIRAIKLPKNTSGFSGGNNRLIGSYDAFTPGNPHHHEEVLASDIDDTEPIYYYVRNQEQRRQGRYARYQKMREDYAAPYKNVVRSFESQCTVVMLPENRVRKFCEQFSDAQEITQFVADQFDFWQAGIDPAVRQAVVYQDLGIKSRLSALDGQIINDPDLLEAVRISTMDTFSVTERRQLFKETELHFVQGIADNPLSRYPLFPDRDVAMNLSHVVLYVNAAYEADQEEE